MRAERQVVKHGSQAIEHLDARAQIRLQQLAPQLVVGDFGNHQPGAGRLPAARPRQHGRMWTAAGQHAERASVEAARVGLGEALLARWVNADLSGGERKRSETLQLAVLQPKVAVLDELDSGLDVDGLRDVAHRVRAAVDEWSLGVLAITHYRRLLDELRPDQVHVFVDGRIVDSGGPEMAESLESSGYGLHIDDAAAESALLEGSSN